VNEEDGGQIWETEGRYGFTQTPPLFGFAVLIRILFLPKPDYKLQSDLAYPRDLFFDHSPWFGWKRDLFLPLHGIFSCDLQLPPCFG
jgi:hypothetical protein